MNTTSCSNCQRYAAIVTETDGVRRLYDYEADGWTVSTARHCCGESDRRHA